MNTATINISLPEKMYKDAKNLSKNEGYSSISELIRFALRGILYPSGLTVNGFTPEFEDLVLESAKEPIKNDIILKNDKDIHDYFINLKIPTKINSRNVKNSTRR
ncbi:MAG: ribbon-helix-helix domain-containing protein [Candidatus Woesebacteria bacterium]|nr:ribbon-helix-helix domain-containing protein [Candidatus Woesebacteria bacterium]